MALHYDSSRNGEGLVWASEVEITVNPKDDSRHGTVFEPHIRPSLGTSSPVSISHQQTSKTFSDTRSDTPFSSGGEADDEGSVYVPSPSPTIRPEDPSYARGRPRSRTKQLRRRGIDLSRDELRTSPCRDSREKSGMENFRGATEAKAQGGDENEKMFAKWTSRALLREVRSAGKKFTSGIRENFGRSRGQRRRRDLDYHEQATQIYNSTTPNGHDFLQSAVCARETATIRAALSSPGLVYPSSSPINSIASPSSDQTLNGMTSTQDTSNTSWEEHLQQDLHLQTDRLHRHRKSRYFLQEQLREKKTAEERKRGRKIVHSEDHPEDAETSNFRQDCTAQPVLRPSVSISAAPNCDVEGCRRLSSLASSSTHCQCFHKTPTSPPVQPECLDEIISSGDFKSEVDDHNCRTLSTLSSHSQSRQKLDRSPTAHLSAALEDGRTQFKDDGI